VAKTTTIRLGFCLSAVQATALLAATAAGQSRNVTGKALTAIYQLAMAIGDVLVCWTVPMRYREVLEYMHGYLAAYPLGFEVDETGQQYIIADRNGYRLGESPELAMVEGMLKSENEAFTNTTQRKTFRQLIAMFATLPSPDENGKPRAILSE
jgi:hypothetical protein